ncbi:hypothetical protein A3709_05610 [Halioglobus sp. HI00S01]|nr:hypothetical protein A3709_05610 [Halioglobus sp. HI00S01]
MTRLAMLLAWRAMLCVRSATHRVHVNKQEVGMNPIVVITDKVMSMMKATVYMAVRFTYAAGATTSDIAAFLAQWTPNGAETYHASVVERVLVDLQHDGLVYRVDDSWYPVISS